MSNAALTAARKIKAGGHSNKHVLNCLCDHADEAGQWQMSVMQIADETELSDDSVRRCLADLVARGLITRRPQYRNGGRLSDLYTITLPAPCGDPSPHHAGTPPAPCEDPPRTTQGPSPHQGEGKRASISIQVAEREAPQASPAPSPDDSPKPKRKTKPKTDKHELPANWFADDVDRGYAKDQHLDDQQINFQERQFLEHWRDPDAADRLKSDWHSTWRKWILRQISWTKGGVANLPRAQDPVSAPKPKAPPRFPAFEGDPQLDAWDKYWTKTRGVGISESDLINLTDGNGRRRRGYLLPAEWPPGYQSEQFAVAA
jgi:hypothetical protein